MKNKSITDQQRELLLKTLQARFEKNMQRHKGMVWSNVLLKLEKNAVALWSLNEMENSGGEPDVVMYDKKSDVYSFYDCAAESPAPRRSFCYDDKALNSRKEHKPKNSAVAMATTIGIELLTESQYRYLQTLGSFDCKTSSWVHTPDSIRKLGGAIFCDRRFDTVFAYHNGAESYYASRGFRGCLTV